MYSSSIICAELASSEDAPVTNAYYIANINDHFSKDSQEMLLRFSGSMAIHWNKKEIWMQFLEMTEKCLGHHFQNYLQI